ncbi:hypothetical protein EON64_17595 [archaeon]|nr:MAG: hypothetical protein EON64_17595 [archaeon]
MRSELRLPEHARLRQVCQVHPARASVCTDRTIALGPSAHGRRDEQKRDARATCIAQNRVAPPLY